MAAKSPPAAHSTDRHLSRQILTHADAYVAEWDRRHAERRILTQYFAGGPRPHQLTYGMAHPKILVFHHDRRRGRILKGGNKSAKTVAGVVEDILWCAGQHPLRRTAPVPVRGRLVAPDLPLTLDRPHVQRDTVRDWCPPQWLRGGSFEDAYSITGHTLHFANGSILEFLSFSQDPQVHAGERLHFCFDMQTRILSERGWVGPDDLASGDLIYTCNLHTGRMEWKPVRFVYRAHHSGSMTRLQRRGARGRMIFDAVVTPDHYWPVMNLKRRHLEIRTTDALRTHHAFLRAAPPTWEMPEVYDDDFVRTVAWVLTEGHVSRRGPVTISQAKHRTAIRVLSTVGKEVRVPAAHPQWAERSIWNVVGQTRVAVRDLLGPDKRCPMSFILMLSRRQLHLFYETMLDGDGMRRADRTVFTQRSRPHIAETFEIVCVLLGKATRTHVSRRGDIHVWVQTGQRFGPRVRVANVQRETLSYDDEVWCPNTENGTVVAKRGGTVYLSGNCHFDEEPPRPIWAENMARLARGLYLGEWWMTYVPVAGLAWIEQELYRPALEERGPFGLHEVTIWDNVHNLPAGFIETLQESFREDEQKVRLYGQYGIREGLVFDLFGADHVVEAGQFVVVRE